MSSSANPSSVPQHVAVIMDGNGRWAQQRGLPRAMGHRAGIKSVRTLLQSANDAGVRVLTLYAFSQENWLRPAEEVRLLMQLFIKTLADEVDELHAKGIGIRFIGEREKFDPLLQTEMRRAEDLTRPNTSLSLVIAVGYSGQWDLVQAARQLAVQGVEASAEAIEARLSTAGLPLPDLMIRTGGEVRISNFLLWQLAYSELYFCDTLWPDFGADEFRAALDDYAQRQRRYGKVPEPG